MKDILLRDEIRLTILDYISGSESIEAVLLLGNMGKTRKESQDDAVLCLVIEELTQLRKTLDEKKTEITEEEVNKQLLAIVDRLSQE